MTSHNSDCCDKKSLAIAFGASFLLGGCLIGSINLPRLWSLSRNHLSASANVVRLDPTNHNTYIYAYRVGGMKYVDSGYIPDRGLKLGEQIEIAYCPDKPEWSSDENIELALRRESSSVLAGATLLAFAITIMFLRAAKSTSSEKSEKPRGLGIPERKDS